LNAEAATLVARYDGHTGRFAYGNPLDPLDVSFFFRLLPMNRFGPYIRAPNCGQQSSAKDG
jgi:hypothetical protein